MPSEMGNSNSGAGVNSGVDAFSLGVGVSVTNIRVGVEF
jgi:hypothetical protein